MHAYVHSFPVAAGAQKAAVQGWIQAIEIAFTKTYALINSKTCPGCGPELLHACLLGTLGLVKELAGRQAGELAETLAGAARVLLSKLQELASSSLSLGLPGDPLSQVGGCRVGPAACTQCAASGEANLAATEHATEMQHQCSENACCISQGNGHHTHSILNTVWHGSRSPWPCTPCPSQCTLGGAPFSAATTMLTARLPALSCYRCACLCAAWRCCGCCWTACWAAEATRACGQSCTCCCCSTLHSAGTPADVLR